MNNKSRIFFFLLCVKVMSPILKIEVLVNCCHWNAWLQLTVLGSAY